MSSSELMISQKISSPPSVVDSSHKASCDRTKPTTFVVTRPDDQSLTAVERRGRWTIGSRTKFHAAGLGTSSPLRRDREFEAPSLQWRVEGKPAAVDGAPRRRRRKKAGLIEIELEGGRRVRVDRDVDAAALERVLMKKIRKYLHLALAA